MARALDAFALLCALQGEPGAAKVEAALSDAADGLEDLLICSINLGEVYYRLRRTGQRTKADSFLRDVVAGRFPIRVVRASNRLVWQAAKVKAEHRMSYAGAFAVALAREHDAEILTGDPEILGASDAVGVRVDSLT